MKTVQKELIAKRQEIEEKLQKEIDGFEKYEIVENSLIDKEIRKTGVIVYEK